MRFLADMGISPATVVYLRRLGFDATGLDRLRDSDILQKAREEARVILTLWRDGRRQRIQAARYRRPSPA